MSRNGESRKSKLLSYLQSGNAVTKVVARKQFKLKNLTATIADLRNEGHYIATEKTKDHRLKYVM